MSIKMRYLIFYILMGLGGAFVAVDILFDFAGGAQNQNLPWALITGLVFIIAAFVFRLVAMKCPFCNCKLRDPNGPQSCPTCGKSADERPEQLPAKEEDQ